MSDVNIKISIDSKNAETNIKRVEAIGTTAAKNISSEFSKTGSSTNNISIGLKSASTAWGTFQGMVASQIVVNSFSKIVGVVQNMGSVLLKEATELENTTLKFNAMTGSAEKTAKILQELQDIKTIIPEENLQKAATLLLQTSYSTDKVSSTLKVLGDISATTGIGLEELTTNFIRVRENSSELPRIWKSMAAQAPLLRDAMAEAAGEKGITSVSIAMEKGKITADIFQRALEIATDRGGKAFNGMSNEANTLTGKFETLIRWAKNLAEDLGTKLIPPLKKLLDNFIELVKQNEKTIKSFLEFKVIDPIVKMINSLADAISKLNSVDVANWFDRTGEAISSFLDTMKILALLGGLIKAMDLLTKIVEAFIVVKTAAETAAVASANTVGFFESAITKISGFFAKLLGATTAYATAIGQLGRLFSGFGTILSAVWSEGLNEGEDALLAQAQAANKSSDSLKTYAVSQSDANKALEEFLSLSQRSNYVTQEANTLLPKETETVNRVVTEQTTTGSAFDTSNKSDEDRKNTEKLEKEIKFQEEIRVIREDGNIAAQEDEINYYQQSDDLWETRLGVKEEQVQQQIEVSNKYHEAELRANANLIKDHDKREKKLEQITFDARKRNIANQRAADQQLLAANREYNQTMVSGAFGLANTLAEVAGGSAATQFAIQKTLAIAQATVAAFMASSLALANPPGPPWTIPVSQVAFQMGMANVGFIAATGMIQAVAGKYASGGIVPGSSFQGDRIPAQVNSGEMILNKQQQTSLFQQINSGQNNSTDNGGIISAIKEAIAGINITLVADDKAIAKSASRGFADGIAFGRA